MDGCRFHFFSPHILCSHLNTLVSLLCHTDCILRGRELRRDSWGDYKYVLYIFASSPVPLAAATGGPRYCGNQSLTVNVVPGRAKCYPSSSYSLPGARRRCPGLPRLCTIRTWQTDSAISVSAPPNTNTEKPLIRKRDQWNCCVGLTVPNLHVRLSAAAHGGVFLAPIVCCAPTHPRLSLIRPVMDRSTFSTATGQKKKRWHGAAAPRLLSYNHAARSDMDVGEKGSSLLPAWCTCMWAPYRWESHLHACSDFTGTSSLAFLRAGCTTKLTVCSRKCSWGFNIRNVFFFLVVCSPLRSSGTWTRSFY